MPLTRSQLISGDKTKGTVLAGQVQGVRKGPGVLIANNGVISFDSSSAEGVVKTNNTEAFNLYTWPTAAPGNNSQLIFNTDGNELSWNTKESFGFGFNLDVGEDYINVKPIAPVESSTPAIGDGLSEAVSGSLYWNSATSQLFICVGDEWQPAVSVGTAIDEALLAGAYTLYVNPEIGSDEYITGWYNEGDGISNQMVTAGYTPQKPFKTIQRAALEVARIQYGMGQDSQAYDRFLIKCSTGVHTVYNDPGVGLSEIDAWANELVPDSEDLIKLNDLGYAGVILPRGVSIIGEDLRKTVIRPTYVPLKSGNIETGRGSIFRITGGAFFFNFTFKDQEGLEESHHLLDCFSFVTEADLSTYYAKTEVLFSQSYENEIVNPGETEIVAPQPPVKGSQTEATDGVTGSSPYIFNCSVRSLYGMCGINANGNGVTGFRSMVVAQFTGVSLQKDMYCWQIYDADSDSWVELLETEYSTYIGVSPDDVRMNPDRVSFHVRAINGAFIQEVSVFAIGQGLHHWVKNGGEISITNSNSSFGGCAALAEGYKGEAFPQDTNWNIGAIVVSSNLNNQVRTVSNISLGTVDGSVLDNSLAIKLTTSLIDSLVYPGIPEILASKGYSFTENSYLWIENPQGDDWRAELSATAWDPETPDVINITSAMENQNGQTPGEETVDGNLLPSLAGKTVYIRRLQDTRTLEQRRYTLQVTNTDSIARPPQRDYVIQTTTEGSGGNIVGTLPNSLMTAVYKTGSIPVGGDPVIKKSEIVLGRTNFNSTWVSTRLYRPGDTVRYAGKHYTCVIKNSDTAFTQDRWAESYVHMSSGYNAYDYINNIAPQVIFDNDTDGLVGSTTCGYEFNPADPQYCWKDDAKIKAQYRNTTDYGGARQFLVGIGFSGSEADNILLPQNPDEREKNPASSVDMLGYIPDGAADGLNNWPVEFRRPSIIRLFGHAWEWAGFLNYTKALPLYQADLSIQNQFTYYFTNQLGGRVYATGYNQEGFLVTPAGLTDLATGSTTDIAALGSPVSGIDVPTNFETLSVDNLTVTSQTILNGSVTFPTSAQATVTEQGIVNKLANYDNITNPDSPFIATDDASINASSSNGGVVTLNGLNAWKTANKLVSAATGSLEIWVSEDLGDDRSLAELLVDPPTSTTKAVKTLQNAALYVNEVLLGSERTAIINIGAGLYDPASTWLCNVQFKAWKRDLSAMTFPSNNIGTTTVANNYFDGSGYGKYDDTTTTPPSNDSTVNFWAYRIELRDVGPSGGSLQVSSSARTMTFNRSVDFLGGFHFLGIAEIIKAADLGAVSKSSVLIGAPNTVDEDDAWSSDTATNVDNLLNNIRVLERGSTTNFTSYAGGSLMVFSGLDTDVVRLRDCVFGSGLPARKEAFSGSRPPLLATESELTINIHNIYFRGTTTITSLGIGVTSPVPFSGDSHYGKVAVNAPWVWSQTYPTFIGSTINSFSTVTLLLGSNFSVKTDDDWNSETFYCNGTATEVVKLLPNHIHLLDSNGDIPINDSPATNGPFFDQFVHSPGELKVRGAWRGGGGSESSNTVGKRLQGFVGKFGKNSYNETKTRGVLGGNGGYLDPETGFILSPASKDYTNARSIFVRAGLDGDDVNESNEVAFCSFEVIIDLSDSELNLKNTQNEDPLFKPNHPFKDGDTVRISAIPGESLPGGLSNSITYYIVNSTQTTFKLSRTSSGSPVTITGTITSRYIVTLFTTFDISSIDAGNDLINCPDHPFIAGNRVVFTCTDANLPDGLNGATSYYVISEGLTPDAFKVSVSPEGTPVDIEGPVSDDYVVSYLGLSPLLAGTGFPTGYNPVIECDCSGFANLNVALRSYGLGINSRFASQIPASNVIV